MIHPPQKGNMLKKPSFTFVLKASNELPILRSSLHVPCCHPNMNAILVFWNPPGMPCVGSRLPKMSPQSQLARAKLVFFLVWYTQISQGVSGIDLLDFWYHFCLWNHLLTSSFPFKTPSQGKALWRLCASGVWTLLTRSGHDMTQLLRQWLPMAWLKSLVTNHWLQTPWFTLSLAPLTLVFVVFF